MPESDTVFEFAVERERRLLKFRLSGFWTVADAEAFHHAFRRNLTLLGPGPFQIFVDLVEFTTQMPEIQDLVKAEMKYSAEQGLTRASHVVDSTYTEHQITRMGGQSHSLEFGFFLTAQEAMDWLDVHAASDLGRQVSPSRR
ncbi:MAG: hypothetical protein R2761_14725 [Acidimicrobiales bacterium]